MRGKLVLSFCVLLAASSVSTLRVQAAEVQFEGEHVSSLGRLYMSPETNVRYQEELTETVATVDKKTGDTYVTKESTNVATSTTKDSRSKLALTNGISTSSGLLPSSTSGESSSVELELELEKVDLAGKPLDETKLPSDFSGYVSIDQKIDFKGETWYQISNNGTTLGYVLANESLVKPYLTITDETKLSGSFGTLLEDVIVYSSFDGLYEENVTEIGTVTKDQNIDVLSTLNVVSTVESKDPDAVSITYKGLSGWVQSSDLVDGKFVSDSIMVSDSPYFEEYSTVIDHLKSVKGEKPEVIETVKPNSTVTGYVKVLVNDKVGYIKSSSIQIRNYGSVTSEKAITDLVKVKPEISATTRMFDQPDHLAGSKVISETTEFLNEVPLVATTEKIVNFEGLDYVYYYLTRDGVGIGWVGQDAIAIYRLTTEKEIISSTNTVDLITKRYGVTLDYLKEQNPTINLDDATLCDGKTIYLAPEEIKYDVPVLLADNISEKTKSVILGMSEYSRLLLQEGLYPSVMMAQALLESSMGTSDLAVYDHNLFGIKGTYNGSGTEYLTSEDAGGGSMYTITASFRSYPTYRESILDYVDLISNSGIYDAKYKSSPRECIQAIKDGGYATDSAYVSKVMQIIEDYNLTQFDI